ncbi:MAG: metalloendopeptidase [Alphaproteobacteria bacterium]|nr:MAG: metalloendopeptidase [Alphaproteobacteria bacterium]
MLLPALVAALLAGGGFAAAQTGGEGDAGALLAAKREADEATRRSQQLEQQAAQATNEAARARAEAAALAARIEAAEADISAAEARVRIIAVLAAQQRARLAEKQAPLVRLTAALQTMARRPPALALVQPGSVDDVVHIRSLLASTLPVVRARTAALRYEVERGEQLRRQAGQAYAALIGGREELRKRRIALAQFEAKQRLRSESLMESALTESDRALAFGEEARELATLAGTHQFQAELRRSLSALPPPPLRPGTAPGGGKASYLVPVSGRVVTGLGEISDAGIHARGSTFATAAAAPVVAPRAGRILFAAPFRGYGQVVIIDHGGGWTTAITNLSALSVAKGESIAAGAPLGRAATGSGPQVTVELRHDGHPFPIAPLIG